MPRFSPLRLLPLAAVGLLAACAHQRPPGTLTLDAPSRHCTPLELHSGQTLNLRLPSNPSTGLRWELRDAGAPALRLLGPEVYTTPEDAGVVGSAGVSTWRFRAETRGEGRLALDYRRPWENGVAAERSFECRFRVR
ncbi:protease inhibitor I42 family protein [Pseudomonas stutzeri]|nr:protease inhibitor I42 family protein [Stutzerimonas stutzeri]